MLRFEKEHIIPFGLDGNLVLPNASCDQCSAITAKFEQTCLRTMLGPARIRLGLRTRRPKSRPKELYHRIIHPSGRLMQKLVPIEKHPLCLWAYELPPAGILEGKAPKSELRGKLWINYPNDLTNRLGPPGTATILVEARGTPMFRMLAKIAHSYAVAEEGLESFRSALMDVIFDRCRTATHWIGGLEPRPIYPGNPLHVLDSFSRTVNGTKYMLARVSLFYGYGAPGYEIVVGECT